MAKVLFFIQLMAVLVVLPLWPGLDPKYAGWGLGFLALVLTAPVSAAGAVFGPRAVVQAMKDAWAPQISGSRSRYSVQVWAMAVRLVPVGGILGGLAAVSGAIQNLEPDRPFGPQVLVLGFFCLVWGLLGLLVVKVLGEVARRLVGAPVHPFLILGPNLAARFGLTPRETETAQAVLDGLTYKDAAAKLFISPATVKSHVLSVYQKTGAGNKIELLRLVEAENTRFHQKADGPSRSLALS